MRDKHWSQQYIVKLGQKGEKEVKRWEIKKIEKKLEREKPRKRKKRDEAAERKRETGGEEKEEREKSLSHNFIPSKSISDSQLGYKACLNRLTTKP
jgi:ribosome-binding ATPase YchF (GTP1/OBG family)